MTAPLLCTIPYCGRLNYLRMLLATIRDADGVDTVQVRIYRTRRDAEIPQSLLRGLDAQIVELEPAVGRYAHHDVWQHAFVEHYQHDFLLNFDSDAVVHPWVFTKTREMIQRFPDMGMGCLFNQESDPDLDFGDPHYFHKASIGFLAAIVSRQLVAAMWGNPAVDRGYSAACAAAGWPIVCTRTSFVEHLGWEGLNSPAWTQGLPQGDRNPDGSIRIARARRFMSEFQ